MTTTILLLLVEVGLVQVPGPCGNTPQYPCYTKPAEPEQPPFIRNDAGVTFMVPSDATISLLRTSEGTVISPQCLCRCERETVVQVQQDERAMCKLAVEEQARKDSAVAYGAMMLGSAMMLIMTLYSMLANADKLATAWRRSELPAQMFIRAAFYFLCAFSGTMLAVGLYRI